MRSSRSRRWGRSFGFAKDFGFAKNWLIEQKIADSRLQREACGPAADVCKASSQDPGEEHVCAGEHLDRGSKENAFVQNIEEKRAEKRLLISNIKLAILNMHKYANR